MTLDQHQLDRRHKTLLASALGFGVALRFYRLDRPQLWLDEILQLLHFRHSGLWENLSELRNEIAAVPLDYIIQKGVVTLAGTTEFWARFHAAVFGILALLAFYSLASRLLSSRAAVFATIILAVFPLHWFYSQEGRNYSLFFFLTLGSYLTLVNALQQGGRIRWLFFGLTNLALLYTNYFGLLVFGGQVFWLSVLRGTEISRVGRPWRIVILPFLTGWIIPWAFFLPWMIWTSGSIRPRLHDPLTEEGLWLRLFKEISGGSYPLSLLLLLLAGTGWFFMARNKNWPLLSLTIGWFILPIPATLVLDWWGGYFVAIRQFLFSTPGLLLASALGIEAIPSILQTRRTHLIQILALALVVLLGTGTILLSDKKQEADWRGLGDILREETSREDTLICAPGLDRIIEFYVTGIQQRSIPIDRILFYLEHELAARVILLESRYHSPEEKRAISEAGATAHVTRTRAVPGFRIYVLESRRKP